MLARAFAILLVLLSAQAEAQSRIPVNAMQYRIMLTKEARSVWGMDANVALFAAQTHQESAWNPDAKSWVGARGLGQHMPGTAGDLNKRYPELAALPMFSPQWSIRALVLYDREIWVALRPFRTEIGFCDRYAMMLSGYNGGPGWVSRDRRLTQSLGGDPDVWFAQVELNTKRSAAAAKENRAYPRLILTVHLPKYLAAGYPGTNPCK